MAPAHHFITRRSFLILCPAALAAPAAPVAAQQMPRVTPAFDLVSHLNQNTSEAALKGATSLVFFGFTRCPDICPTTLFEISQLYAELKREGDRLRSFFVSIDPEHDTPERLALYLQSFDPRITGLTGDRPQVERALTSFLAHAEKIDTPAGESWTHSTGVYVIDRKGAFRGFLPMSDGPARAARELRPFLNGR